MTRPRYTIAVTGLNVVDSPGPGIAVIRGLRESTRFDVRIIGLAYENMEPGIYMRDMVDKTYIIPYPSAGHQVLLERLQYIHHQEKLDIIIPNFDAELIGFIRLQPVLQKMGIRSLLPGMDQFEERLKDRLPEYGKRYDVLVPTSEPVTTISGLHEALKKFELPVMVKGKFYEAYRAYSEEQAVAYFHKLSAKWGTPVILQQYIAGQEYNVTALGDGKGGLIGAVPMRKTFITESGKGWAGITIADQGLLDMARHIVTQTRWAGGMELELMKEEKSGKVYLLEINPRFPAWVYLATGAGQNHPEALVRLVMGDDPEPMTQYKTGTMFIRYAYDMICNLEDYASISTTGEL